MALDAQAVRIIIFDMDDTLFDTFGQLVKPASFESCQAMIDAGLNASIDDCLKARIEIGISKPRANIYRELVKHFGIREDALKSRTQAQTAEAIAAAGSSAFFDREIKESIVPFADALETLKALGQTHKLYLVTLGAIKTQKRKVELLGFSPFFERVFYSDVNSDKNKRRAFKEILQLHQPLPAHEFLAVGNRLDSEIREAKELGMQTVLMEHGEYVHLKPSDSFEEPDARIKKLSELTNLLKSGGHR